MPGDWIILYYIFFAGEGVLITALYDYVILCKNVFYLTVAGPP